MIKVAHVVSSLQSTYLKNFITNLDAALKPQQIQGIIICLQDKGVMNLDSNEEYPLPIHTLNKKSGIDLAALSQLGKILKQEKIDIAHSHNLDAVTTATLAAKLKGIKSINSCHYFIDNKVPGWIWNSNQHVICKSEYLKNNLLKKNRIKANRLKIIYEGVMAEDIADLDKTAVTQNLRQQIGLQDDSLIIGNIAHLVREADQETLIKTLQKLLQKKMKVQLVLAGDGPLRPQLEELIKKENLSDSVKLLGERKDLKELMCLFDLFVLPAFVDHYANLIPAAMLAKKPAVATKIGSHVEYIKEGETGYLVPCGFPERIESAIMRLCANKTLNEKICTSAFKFARDHFTFSQTAQAYEQIYRTLKK